MKPVLSFSVVFPSVSAETAESCLERRFNLLKIDLKPLDEVGEVGDVGSVEEGAVTVEPCVCSVVLETRTAAVGSSYRSSFPSVAVAVAVARAAGAGVVTTVVPRAGPVAGVAREASLDFRCSSLAIRSSSAFLDFSASFACLAAAFSSALRVLAALFSSSKNRQYSSRGKNRVILPLPFFSSALISARRAFSSCSLRCFFSSSNCLSASSALRLSAFAVISSSVG